MRKITSLIVCLVAMLAIAVPAHAQSVTQDAYQGQAGAQQGGGGGTAGTTQASGGSLPFTGVQLGLMGLAGVALLGTGYGLRRASQFRDGTA
jgi:hypothetical protein